MNAISQRAFALFEVLLAIIVLSMVMFGLYKLFGQQGNSSQLRLLQGDLTSITQAIQPFLGSADSGSSVYTPFAANNALQTDFLSSVPIAKTHLVAPDTSSTYLLTGLSMGTTPTCVGFAQYKQQTTAGTTSYYLVMAMSVNHSQLSEMLQLYKSTFGVFYGTTFEGASYATTIPSKTPGTQDSYTLYLTSPMATDISQFTAVSGAIAAPTSCSKSPT